MLKYANYASTLQHDHIESIKRHTLLISLACHLLVAEESSSDLNPASILDPILATDDVLGTCPKVIEMSNVARPVMVDRRLSKSNLFFLSRKTTSSDLLSLKYISNLDKSGQNLRL
jgi:hypothetical protein